MDTTQGIAARRLFALGRRPDFWLGGLLLWTLLSAGRSLGTPWSQAALTEAVRWSAGIGLALMLGWYLSRPQFAGQVLVTLTGALALAGTLGAVGTAHGGLTGPYHDHQLYGSVLLILLPFCASQALTSPQTYWRWGALAALTAGTLCLLLSQARSAWAGLAVAALVFGWLWLRHTPLGRRQWKTTLVPLFLLLFVLLGVWVVAGPREQQAALGSRAVTLTVLAQDESWQSRLTLWRGAGHLVEAHPCVGIGLGRYPGEQWCWTHAGGPLAPGQRPSLTNEAHSFYGQTAAETGLIGLGLFLAALAAFAVQGMQRLGRCRRALVETDGLLIAALSALAGQSMDALASPSWQFPEASFFFWAVLGLGLATLRRDQKQSVPALSSPPLRRVVQYALSGSLAVVFTAQVLPLGLLSPVEAYAAPTGWILKSVAVSLVSPAAPLVPGPVQFKVLATYLAPGGILVTEDGTNDTASTTYGAFVNAPYKSYPASAFMNGKMILTAGGNGIHSTLSVTVYYQDTATKAFVNNTGSPLIIPLSYP